MVSKIVSGGQTGVDRAALDVAMSSAIDCGGWCPAARRAEDGAIPLHYPLEETPSKDYAQRTQWNVRDSDATLIVVRGEPTGGTALTIQRAEQHGKPCMIVDLDQPVPAQEVIGWLVHHQVETLNIAGPRESISPGIYRAAYEFLAECLTSC